jgi:hypothetical protein
MRRGLEPSGAGRRPDLDRAVRDALAVYYFPGMWDWDPSVVLPLVVRALEDALARQDGGEGAERAAVLERGRRLLVRYFAWAPAVDRLSPVRVETDFDVVVADPADPERGLVAGDGGEVRYRGRVDLLAVDEHDRFWVVRHRLCAGRFPPVEQVVLDEEARAACWAVERFNDLEVAGSIHNELGEAEGAAVVGPTVAAGAPSGHPRGGISQHEPSGGGREASSLRRLHVPGRAVEDGARVSAVEGAGFRRVVVRRGREELRAAGVRIAEEAADMVGAGLRLYPSPGPENCSACLFVPPCLAAEEGRDPEPLLAGSYHRRPAETVEAGRGRLGGSSFGVGRGWVPGG